MKYSDCRSVIIITTITIYACCLTQCKEKEDPYGFFDYYKTGLKGNVASVHQKKILYTYKFGELVELGSAPPKEDSSDVDYRTTYDRNGFPISREKYHSNGIVEVTNYEHSFDSLGRIVEIKRKNEKGELRSTSKLEYIQEATHYSVVENVFKNGVRVKKWKYQKETFVPYNESIVVWGPDGEESSLTEIGAKEIFDDRGYYSRKIRVRPYKPDSDGLFIHKLQTLYFTPDEIIFQDETQIKRFDAKSNNVDLIPISYKAHYDYEYDSQGNWITRTVLFNDKALEYLFKRTIIYH